MSKKRYFFIFSFFFVFFLLLAGKVEAATYYVSKLGNNQSGNSWTTAWNELDQINWEIVQPGDVIEIDGGSSSMIYHSPMKVIQSGSSDSPITITRSNESEHNGIVLIDGQGTVQYGIYVESQNNIIVKNLYFDNWGSSTIRFSRCDYCIAEENIIDVHGHGGVFVQYSTGVVVNKNIITTPDYLEAQTDGIYSQVNNASIYENNHITINNNEPSGHDDGIQLYRDRDTTIRFNYIEQNNNKQSNAQGIYATNSYGTIKAYGNVVYGPNTKNGLLTLRVIDEGDARLLAYNNTLVGGGWGTIIIDNAPNSIVKNNLLACYKNENLYVFRLYPSLVYPEPENIDYNLYYLPYSAYVASYASSPKSWLQWQDYGYEFHGLNNQNPVFENIAERNFRLKASSPAKDAGINLDSIYNTDADGILRGADGSWDIGAYEYVSVQPSPSPQSCLADLTNDGQVNHEDLKQVLSLWKQTCLNCKEDLNQDDKINVWDLGLVIKDWGECK